MPKEYIGIVEEERLINELADFIKPVLEKQYPRSEPFTEYDSPIIGNRTVHKSKVVARKAVEHILKWYRLTDRE